MGYNCDFWDIFWIQNTGNCIFWVQNCTVLRVKMS